MQQQGEEKIKQLPSKQDPSKKFQIKMHIFKSPFNPYSSIHVLWLVVELFFETVPKQFETKQYSYKCSPVHKYFRHVTEKFQKTS